MSAPSEKAGQLPMELGLPQNTAAAPTWVFTESALILGLVLLAVLLLLLLILLVLLLVLLVLLLILLLVLTAVLILVHGSIPPEGFVAEPSAGVVCPGCPVSFTTCPWAGK